MTNAFLMTLCRYFQLCSVSWQSTEFFYWGLYLLVGKVGGTKNEIEVQEFQTPILIKFHSNETLQCFLRAHKRRQSTANMHQYFLPMYSFTDYSDHLTNF